MPFSYVAFVGLSVSWLLNKIVSLSYCVLRYSEVPSINIVSNDKNGK